MFSTLNLEMTPNGSYDQVKLRLNCISFSIVSASSPVVENERPYLCFYFELGILLGSYKVDLIHIENLHDVF